MRAGTRERIMRARMMTERMIRIMARGSTIMPLVISICLLMPKAAAQSDKYPKMAPVDQYLMERNAEILLPPILVFAVEVTKWADGTVAPTHQE
jgi:hypothetical protein